MPGMRKRGVNKSNVVTNYDDFQRRVAPVSTVEKPSEKTYDYSTEDFKMGKKDVLDSIQDLLTKYEDFTNDVSPKHWRLTGHHITFLKNMIDEIKAITPISEEEKEIDWVKQSRFKDE